MSFSPLEMTILWSTQGGRAKACARRTSRILRDYYYENEGVTDSMNDENEALSLNYYGMSFDDFGAEDFLNLGMQQTPSNDKDKDGGGKKHLVIMFVSTTGDGEHCDCIQDTWKLLLRKALPTDQCSNLQFALFCLGDRAYGPTAFCAAGRKLATRLIQLGAQTFCNIGYGDDGTPNGGVFQDLDTWIQNDFIPSFNKGGDDVVNRNISHANRGEKGKIGMNGGSALVHSNPIASQSKLRHRPLSPYQCETLHDNSNNTNQQLPSKEEWQLQQYNTSYNLFFQSLRPKNSYEYQYNKRITTNSNLQKNDMRDENKSSKSVNNNDNDNNKSSHWPLIGKVTTNQRLTSKKWKQETRHFKIHIKSKSNNSSSLSSLLSPNTITPLPYMAGDIATILPSNSKSTVEKFISCLPPSIQSKVDLPLSIKTKRFPSPSTSTSISYSQYYTPWPSHCTLRGILTYCVDISSLPEREDLRSLSYYCNPNHPMGVDQQLKLISLSETNSDSASLYGDYVIREKRNWADVLFDFDSICYEGKDEEQQMGQQQHRQHQHQSLFTPLTIEHLLMILSPIMPRHFSIASAPTTSIGKNYTSNNNTGFDIELCVAVVKGKTRFGRQYEGLCSTYLSRLSDNTSHRDDYNSFTYSSKESNILRLWIRPGSFGKLPLDIVSTESKSDNQNNNQNDQVIFPYFQSPIMYIGAGTGIAPLRSLIHEREAMRKQQWMHQETNTKTFDHTQQTRKDNILVFGCRKETEDYYYKDDWISMSIASPFDVITAFSQDQKHKVYVQHIIHENQGILITKHILENGGAVYIAGGAKMAGAVKEAIIECLGEYLPNGLKDARKLLTRLQRIGKFNVEAWS